MSFLFLENAPLFLSKHMKASVKKKKKNQRVPWDGTTGVDALLHTRKTAKTMQGPTL